MAVIDKIPPYEQLVDDYLLCCQTEGKSPQTIEGYSLALRKFGHH